MGTRRTRQAAVVMISSLIVLAGCGGDDDTATTATTDDTATTDTGVADAVTTTAPPDSAAPSETTASSQAPVSAATDGGDAGEGDPLDISDTTQRCQAIFSDTEIDSLFGEPWALDASADESLGQTICSWATLDEAADDLVGAVLTVQVFSGDPIPAANFIDPEIFDDVTMLDGFGELAFVENTFGNNYYFLDEPIAGSLSYSEIDFENPGSEPQLGDDQVLELFRTFHDRVT